MSEAKYTMAMATDKLKQPEAEIRKAYAEVYSLENFVMLSEPEMQKLETVFAERSSNKSSQKRNRMDRKRGLGNPGVQSNLRSSVPIIGERKVRGRRDSRVSNRRKTEESGEKNVQAASLAARGTSLGMQEGDLSSQKAVELVHLPVATARNKELDDEGDLVRDKIFSRNARKKESQEQVAPSQEQVAPSQEQVAPSQEQVAPSQEQVAPNQEQASVEGVVAPANDAAVPVGGAGKRGPQPIGTISLSENMKSKRERSRRKRRSMPKSSELRKQDFVLPVEPKIHVVEVPEEIAVKQLSYLMSVKTNQVLEKLAEVMNFDHDAPPETVDQDVAVLVVEEFGHKPVRVYENRKTGFILERPKTGDEMTVRPPVVTVMGHVDHGKTSLLDYVRKSKIIETEAGGITQHIGAYQVEVDGGKITFIDTPGHEVFTEMRARGAKVTDIVVLVVAADDGVKPQTREAIAHAKSAEAPIVVAVNKMDLPDADMKNVTQQLASHGLQSEEWGGDVIMIPVSATTGLGVDKLLENILLTAELMADELNVPLDTDAYGSIIEVRTEKGLGPIVSVIVKAGVLRKGDFLLCDTEYGRVRAMRDESGQEIKEALPSMPVQVQGVAKLPTVGSEFFVQRDEQSARKYAEDRRNRMRQRALIKKHNVIDANDLDELFAITEAMEESKVLNLVVKTDVAGTCEAMENALEKIGSEKAKMKIIHSGVGAISESDVLLAQASEAMLVGFRVTANPKARRMIKDRKTKTFYSEIFYEVTDHLKERLLGMLDPTQVEHVRGLARVKEVFHINKVGKIAGCAVEEGTVDKRFPVRVVRDGTVINKTGIAALQHYKESVSHVAAGSDCGVSLERFSDFKPGDIIEAYEVIIVAQTL